MKTNTQLNELVSELKKQAVEKKSRLWKRIAADLEGSTRSRKAINISKINILTKENDIVVVPGKVLGNGEMDHKIKIAALNFSGQAADKIKRSNSEIYSLQDLMKANPKGKNVRILV